MADLNDLNKPDATSNYSSEVLQTLKGHISRLWLGDYTGMANLVTNMRRWVDLGSGDAKLVKRNSDGSESTIFESSTKTTKTYVDTQDATKANTGGSNATGTWPINITGNANTATTATTASSPAAGGSFITTSNIGSQSVSYAATAGSAANGGVTSVNGFTGAVTVNAIPGVFGQAFISSGTFTIPAGVTAVKVTVIGGGGGGGSGYWGGYDGCCYSHSAGGNGGSGGVAFKYLTGLSGGLTLAITVGLGGSNASAGGTSSVSSGSQTISGISATGGGAGTNGTGNIGYGSTVNGTNGGFGSPSNYDYGIVGVAGSWSLGGGITGFGFGFGGVPSATSSNGNNGIGYGAGASGGNQTGSAPYNHGTTSGGSGAPGLVFIEW